MAIDPTMNLLMQYLSAAGMDIGAGKPLGANVAAVTNQQVGLNSYARLLKDVLGNGGKMSMDKDNFTLKGPAGALGKTMSNPVSGEQLAPQNVTPTMADPYTGEQLPGRAAAAVSANPVASAATSQGGLNSDFLRSILMGNVSGNPSASPLENLSGAALAGLTPSDVSQALRLKLAQDEMSERKVGNALDNVYRMQQIRANERALNAPPKEDLTSNMKEYRLAQMQGFEGSFVDFMKRDPEVVRTYEYAKNQGFEGTIEDWVMKKAREGATRITLEGKIDEKKALAGIEGQLYFKSGKDQQDIKKYVDSRAFRMDMVNAPDALDEDKAKMYVIHKRYTSTLESMAKSVEPVDIDWKAKTGTWKVTWNDGTEEVIKRALY